MKCFTSVDMGSAEVAVDCEDCFDEDDIHDAVMAFLVTGSTPEGFKISFFDQMTPSVSHGTEQYVAAEHVEWQEAWNR